IPPRPRAFKRQAGCGSGTCAGRSHPFRWREIRGVLVSDQRQEYRVIPQVRQWTITECGAEGCGRVAEGEANQRDCVRPVCPRARDSGAHSRPVVAVPASLLAESQKETARWQGAFDGLCAREQELKGELAESQARERQLREKLAQAHADYEAE